MKKKEQKRNTIALIGICVCLLWSLTGCAENSGADSREIAKQQLNFDEYIKVGTYKGLAFNKKKNAVSKAEVDKEILQRVAETTKLTTQSNGTVITGDLAYLSYKGTVAGNVVAEGENVLYHIGGKEVFKGAEEILLGAPIGEVTTKKVTVKNEGISDQTHKVTYAVTIHYVRRAEVPKYDLTWIKENSTCKKEKSYKKYIKKQLKERKAKEQLWKQVFDNSTLIGVPEVESTVYPMPTTFQAFWNNDPEVSKEESMKAYLIVQDIAKKEGIQYTEEEYLTAKNALLATGYSQGFIGEELPAKAKDYLNQKLLYEKVLDFLLDNKKTKKEKDKEKEKETLESSADDTVKQTNRNSNSQPSSKKAESSATTKQTTPPTTTSAPISTSDPGKDF